MTQNNIPNWLCEDENYKAKTDSGNFVNKSIKAIVKTLASFKHNNKTKRANGANTSFRLLGMLIMIILTSVAKNFSFVIFMLAVAMVRIAILNGEKIKALLKVLMPAEILAFLILLPSIFMGNPKTPLTVMGKIFVCITLVMSLNLSVSFNEITRSLKAFHIPDIFIFTIDLAIKYIAILGGICGDMLTALKIRSIGKNKNKSASASGILGNVFIKSKVFANETAKAMECRGFNGKYVITKRNAKINKYDIIYAVILIAVIAIFSYLEVAL